MSQPPAGRRERNKAEKRRRILAAATKLFSEHGYEAVTTAQIATAADVGTGTVFRYFPTKADLLVEAMTARIRAGGERARAVEAEGAGPLESIMALVDPLLDAVEQHPENTRIYQRETIFGREDAGRRSMADVAGAIEVVAGILERADPSAPAERIHNTAYLIFATVNVDAVRAGLPYADPRPLRGLVRDHVAFILDAALGLG